MTFKKVHYIVASSAWKRDGLRYRRHRLAEYLSEQADTEAVIWVYPEVVGPRQPLDYWKIFHKLKENGSELPENKHIRSFAFPDLIPGRPMRTYRFFQRKYLQELKRLGNFFGGLKVLWYTDPSLPFLLDLFPWQHVIYDCSDHWEVSMDGKTGLKEKMGKLWVKVAEPKIVSGSHTIFATTVYLRDRINEKYKRQAFVVENGVETDFFTAPGTEPPELDIPRPRLGYVGGMKFKIDFALLKKLMAEKAGWQLLLIGPPPSAFNKDYNRLLQMENVYNMGTASPRKVPGYMELLDVGLLPYKEIEYNRGVFPLKLYEYLAAGIPVVGCGVPSTIKCVEEGLYLHVEHDINKFSAACEKALGWGREKDLVDHRRAIAQQADWKNKFAYMLSMVREGIANKGAGDG